VTIIDIHSHWGTRRGYPLQTEQELAQQRATWNSSPNYATEAEMADYFRASGVRAVLDFGFAKFRPLEEMQSLHDYAFATERAHRNAILGHWIHVDPRMGGRGSGSCVAASIGGSVSSAMRSRRRCRRPRAMTPTLPTIAYASRLASRFLFLSGLPDWGQDCRAAAG